MVSKLKTKELAKEFKLRLSYAQFNLYRPFGHPDTVCPDNPIPDVTLALAKRLEITEFGRLWKRKGWEPWSNKPWQLEFHQSKAKERCAVDANGVGKSFCTTWETAAHLTGEYPSWYEGNRFDREVNWWIGAIDSDQQRIGIQAHLLGINLDTALGTGFIPKPRIVGKVSTRQAGISDVADRVMVLHKSGGVSTLTFKTYSQGWRSWQAAAPDGITLDEEPDENETKQRDIFQECQTRIFRSGGLILGGLTPLLGETDVTRHFMHPKASGIDCVYATWDDAPHLKKEDKDRLIATYPPHVVESRTKGIPMMGEGKVFSVKEEKFTCFPFEIPRHYSRIAGIDFGIGLGHPTAGGWLAWDRDKDVVYLTDEYREEGETTVYHAEAFKRRSNWIPVSWPHDGLKRDPKAGQPLYKDFVRHNVPMLPISARYERDIGGGQAQEPIIQELLERMLTGRFYAFTTCIKFFEEVRSYHRKDGKLVARREDVIKAVLYALMMLRHSHTEPMGIRHRSRATPLRI